MNTPDNTPKNPLTRTLEQEAEHFDRISGAGVSLDGVLNRAGEIRRGRRMRATMAMAAVVLAIAVPVGIRAIDSDPKAAEPVPAAQDRSQITLDGLKAGDDPAIGYTVGEVVHTDGWEYSQDGKAPVALAELADGSFLASTNDGAGNLSATYFPKNLNQDDQAELTWPMEGGFAVSPGGTYGAFVQPDGTPIAVGPEGVVQLPKVPAGSGFDAAGFIGEETCSLHDEENWCGLVINSNGEQQAVWVSTSSGTIEQMHPEPGLLQVTALSPHGYVAGFTRFTDDGSCSAVRNVDLKLLWQTCEHRFVQFSPDGKHLLATGPYGSGAGDSELAILDARTGAPVLDLQTITEAVITQMVWEDDEHVLAVVLEDGKAGILRIDLNGNRELALAPVPVTDDFISPIKLAEQ